MLPAVAPELVPLADTPQDPEWHPEGDVWTHTLLAVDQAGAAPRGAGPAARAGGDARPSLAHDLGKPATTQRDRRPHPFPRPRGGGRAAGRRAARPLARAHPAGYDVRGQVLALVGNHLKPGQLYDDRERVSDGAIRRLARKCEPELLYRVARADCLGRTGDFPPVAMEWFLRAREGARGGGAPAAADPAGPPRGGDGRASRPGGRPHRARGLRAPARRRGDGPAPRRKRKRAG